MKEEMVMINSSRSPDAGADKQRPNRREFITAGMSMALATMLPHTAHGALSGSKMKPVTIPRRKLGALEVSAIGLG